jgi:hypothetical protein
LVSSKGKALLTFAIDVDGAEVKPGGTFDLLGVTFDRNFWSSHTSTPWRGSHASEPAGSHDWHNISHVANCCGSSGVTYSWER